MVAIRAAQSTYWAAYRELKNNGAGLSRREIMDQLHARGLDVNAAQFDENGKRRS